MKSLNTITKSTILAAVVMTTSMGVAAASSGYSSDGVTKRTTTVTTTTTKEKRVVEERIAPRRAYTPTQYNNPDPLGSFVGALAGAALLANSYRQPHVSNMCRSYTHWCRSGSEVGLVGSPCSCTFLDGFVPRTIFGTITAY